MQTRTEAFPGDAAAAGQVVSVGGSGLQGVCRAHPESHPGQTYAVLFYPVCVSVCLCVHACTLMCQTFSSI